MGGTIPLAIVLTEKKEEIELNEDQQFSFSLWFLTEDTK